jgi:DNA polymerase elongation subunit (family B)
VIPVPPIWVLDTECYVDYFLVMLRNVASGETLRWDMHPGKSLGFAFGAGECVITFNGKNYDFPILSLAMAGNDNATLKRASDDIILRNMKPWDIEREYGGVDLSGVDHIDLIEVAPGQAGLKIYGGRMHSKRLQDLPIDPFASISEADRVVLIEYCGNDLETTIDLYRKLTPQLDLRREMSREFGIDLRSKSDAQIAEAVIRSEVEKRVGHRVYRPDLHPDYKFRYTVPGWIGFASPGMRQALEIIRSAEFSLSDDGSVELPRILESLRLRIGQGVYRMGIGGLHSSESSVAHVASSVTRIVDRDVTSYYPSIILNQGLYPTHMGPDFLAVYESLVHRRIQAKREGNKVMADALKICVNGSFGKLGSKWSVLYSPDLMIAVTITGQLALLVLIESLELSGFRVISANTDGVVTLVLTERTDEFESLVAAWEMSSGFRTEETEYSALYSKDVNNYIAVKPDGETKLKGLYATDMMSKNPTNTICVEAVIEHLVRKQDVAIHIALCMDPRKFLTIRQVKGGAVYGDQYLGKAVRWYYAKGETRHIAYATNWNKVARSEGARPLMELPDSIPLTLDYEWYINEAHSILADVGL